MSRYSAGDVIIYLPADPGSLQLGVILREMTSAEILANGLEGSPAYYVWNPGGNTNGPPVPQTLPPPPAQQVYSGGYPVSETSILVQFKAFGDPDAISGLFT